ncbi:MAG: hypothetical protein GYA24_08905 [Candidatus Lokiarchaeota archaeon]|nr:hypothetical protein [Candidatus Lokiarchaeota archaeon]
MARDTTCHGTTIAGCQQKILVSKCRLKHQHPALPGAMDTRIGKRNDPWMNETSASPACSWQACCSGPG